MMSVVVNEHSSGRSTLTPTYDYDEEHEDVHFTCVEFPSEGDSMDDVETPQLQTDSKALLLPRSTFRNTKKFTYFAILNLSYHTIIKMYPSLAIQTEFIS